MNKKMIAAGLGLAGIIVIVTVIPGWARLNENKTNTDAGAGADA